MDEIIFLGIFGLLLAGILYILWFIIYNPKWRLLLGVVLCIAGGLVSLESIYFHSMLFAYKTFGTEGTAEITNIHISKTKRGRNRRYNYCKLEMKLNIPESPTIYDTVDPDQCISRKLDVGHNVPVYYIQDNFWFSHTHMTFERLQSRTKHLCFFFFILGLVLFRSVDLDLLLKEKREKEKEKEKEVVLKDDPAPPNRKLTYILYLITGILSILIFYIVW